MDIAPEKQNLDHVFSRTTYHIDFYQRDYRWSDVPTKRLLDDIFFKFNEEYERFSEMDPSKEVAAKYAWYYLNTYVTNEIEGKVYVVDGQQRLTTLTLILVVLKHMGGKYDSKLTSWIERKVSGQSGYENEYWMNHERHLQALDQLFSGVALEDVDTTSGITAVNMVANYKVIQDWLEKELDSQHRFETFVFYFLFRLVLINLAVEQTNVPMVFEVINDRGVRLKPYEILKGQLLGKLDKVELERDDYNGLWESKVKALNAHKDDMADEFLRSYFRAHHANTKAEGEKFDGDYHRELFSGALGEDLQFRQSQQAIKEFLRGPFSYYADVFERSLAISDDKGSLAPIHLNRLNRIESQYMILLSGVDLNDPELEEKMRVIPAEVDRLFSLLQLQEAYDGNAFNREAYVLSTVIRNRPLTEVRPAFDASLMKLVSEKKSREVTEAFQYSFFKNAGNGLATQFKRYFFARVDSFLATEINQNPRQSIDDLVQKTGSKTGFHIEHILSHNEENLALFDGDEERFEVERNRLGGILLLKGRDNISSNNEPYRDKLRSYDNTLYWNETLREDFYKSKLDFREMRVRHDLELYPMPEQFGPEELEQRHKWLFQIAKIIWS